MLRLPKSLMVPKRWLQRILAYQNWLVILPAVFFLLLLWELYMLLLIAAGG